MQPQLSSMKCACAVLHCHFWPVQIYSIFPHYLINGTTFEKEVIEGKMCVLIFSTNFVHNISHPKKI